MTRYLLRLDTASGFSIMPSQTNCNPVMRVGALPEVEAKKAALGRCIASQVNSGENTPAKRLTSFNWSKIMGVLDPPLGKLNWIATQIYAPLCHKPVTVNWTSQDNSEGTQVGTLLKVRRGKHDLRRANRHDGPEPIA